MQRLEVSCAVRHIYIYMSLGAKVLITDAVLFSPGTADRTNQSDSDSLVHSKGDTSLASACTTRLHTRNAHNTIVTLHYFPAFH